MPAAVNTYQCLQACLAGRVQHESSTFGRTPTPTMVATIALGERKRSWMKTRLDPYCKGSSTHFSSLAKATIFHSIHCCLLLSVCSSWVWEEGHTWPTNMPPQVPICFLVLFCKGPVFPAVCGNRCTTSRIIPCYLRLFTGQLA